ncbi:MAG TPA: S1/P1 nuclease [Burkholderiaceae bacterium]
MTARRILRLLVPPAIALHSTLLAPDEARAWGGTGHRALAAVADTMLTESARASVAELLADDLDLEGRPSPHRRLSEVAGWADEIRDTTGDRPRWHFDDRPVCESLPVARNWRCIDGQCASGRLEALVEILADGRNASRARSLALKWIVHLVGDLHQPLHAADLARGGNAIAARLPGRRASSPVSRPLSLHAAWDVDLVEDALHLRHGAIPASRFEQLLTRARRFGRAELAAAPQDWSVESNRLARGVALRLDGIRCGAGLPERVQLSRRDAAVAERIIFERLALAGARLSWILNQHLGDHASTSRRSRGPPDP